jgi:hypothetical protein
MGYTLYITVELSVIHINDRRTIGYTPYTTVELSAIYHTLL